MAQRRMRSLQTTGLQESPSERRRLKASHHDAFLISLDNEISTQESQIRQCRIRLAALRAVRKRYTEGHVIGSLQRSEPTGKASRAPRRQQSQKSIIVSAVNDLLRQHSGPVPTKAILDRLLRGGIKVGGGNPARFLSVVLSTSGRFVAHGHSGWTLVGKS